MEQPIRQSCLLQESWVALLYFGSQKHYRSRFLAGDFADVPESSATAFIDSLRENRAPSSHSVEVRDFEEEQSLD